ncbi:MAG: antibiotic biosynthesis monooxygenase [Thermomicrobiales bacterium]
MITTMNRIFVNPDYAEQFENNFRERAGLVDRMGGFISNQLLRPSAPGDPYIVLTQWQTRAQFEAWVRSPEFAHGHARSGSLPREAYSAPNKLELHEVILDTDRPNLEPEPHNRPFNPHGS